MKSLRRYNVADSVYFITMVTFNREPILTSDISLFWNCWENLNVDAWVILPDHTHLILANNDLSISKIIHRFKTKYSRLFRDKVRPGRVWQNRFWDHVIRDENDWRRHIDYIHFNPVKHGIVDDPFVYPHSSIGKFHRLKMYERNWGVISRPEFDGAFGE